LEGSARTAFNLFGKPDQAEFPAALKLFKVAERFQRILFKIPIPILLRLYSRRYQ
jgi:hypothetical protein